MTRFLSILVGLTSLATPTVAQLPDVSGLLALLPPQCLLLVQSAIIPCFTANTECLTMLPTVEDIESLPAAEDIMICEDISEPVCPILTKCEPCLMEMGDLLSCVLTNNEDISQDTVDLINGCAFDCEEGGGGMNVTESMSPNVTEVPTTTPPISAPISAPPVASPTSEDTEAPSAATTSDTPALSTAATTSMSMGIVGLVVTLSSFLVA
jgi:hypothetical protein